MHRKPPWKSTFLINWKRKAYMKQRKTKFALCKWRCQRIDAHQNDWSSHMRAYVWVHAFALLYVSSSRVCIFSAPVSVRGAQGWGGVCDHVQASRRLYEDGWDSSVEARHETTEIPLRSSCVSQHNNTRAGSLCTLKQTWASSLQCLHTETSDSLHYISTSDRGQNTSFAPAYTSSPSQIDLFALLLK